MTPKERFLSALALDMPDRIPTMHIQLGGGNRLQDITGLTIKEAYSDPEKFAQMCLATREFGFDNVMVGWGDLLNEAQAFGVKLSFPNERDYPRGVPILPEDIDKLDYVDPMKDRVWFSRFLEETTAVTWAAVTYCRRLSMTQTRGRFLRLWAGCWFQ